MGSGGKLQSPILKRLIVACLAFATALSLSADCGPLTFNGRHGDEFWLLELATGLVSSEAASTPTKVPILAIRSDGGCAFRRRLPERSISIVPGSGKDLWLATRTESAAVRVRAVTERKGGAPDSAVRVTVPFDPVSYSWSRDKRGAWLFFEGYDNETRKVAAYTLDDGSWRLREVVDTSLSPPQYDPKSDTIYVGTWRLSRETAAELVAVPEVVGRRGLRLVPELIPTTTGELVASSSGRLWVSRDEGATWNTLDTPWSRGTYENLQRVPAEARVVFTWRDGDARRVVAEWKGEWSTLATTTGNVSYVLVSDGRVILVDGCASRNAVDITTIENGRTTMKQVPVLEGP